MTESWVRGKRASGAVTRRAMLARLASGVGLTMGASTLLAACQSAPSTPPPPATVAAKPASASPAAATSSPPASSSPVPGSPSPSPAAQSKPAAPTTPATAEKPGASAPKRGGILKIPVNANITPWPLMVQLHVIMVTKSMFNQLVRYAPDWSPQPDLAERWEVSADGLSWTFHLRKGVTWHDGTPFTAEDVKYSLDLYKDPKLGSVHRSSLAPVTTSIVDAHTVKLVTQEPYSSLVELLSYLAFMLPKHLLEKEPFGSANFPEAFVQQPVGTGPFKFGEHVPGDHFTVVANDSYYEGRPHLDSIIYKVVRDLNSTVAQVTTGELDMAFPIPSQLPTLQAAANVTVVEREVMNYRFFAINHKDPTVGRWYGDKVVRQALAHAIDTQGIIQQVTNGKADQAFGPIPPALKNWYVKDAPTFAYDPEKARKMLVEYGFKAGPDGMLAKDGQPFAFPITFAQGTPEFEQMSLVLQQNFKDVGINAELKPTEVAQMNRGFQIDRNLPSIATFFITPITPGLRTYWQTGNSANYFGYSNPEIDRLYQEGAATFDPTKQREIYTRLYTQLAEEQPVNFVYHARELQAINKRVRGLPETDFRNAFPYLNRVWLDS